MGRSDGAGHLRAAVVRSARSSLPFAQPSNPPTQPSYEGFSDPSIPKFMYGSHYSTAAGVVLHYLVRLQPFADLHREMQVVHYWHDGVHPSIHTSACMFLFFSFLAQAIAPWLLLAHVMPPFSSLPASPPLPTIFFIRARPSTWRTGSSPRCPGPGA